MVASRVTITITCKVPTPMKDSTLDPTIDTTWLSARTSLFRHLPMKRTGGPTVPCLIPCELRSPSPTRYTTHSLTLTHTHTHTQQGGKSEIITEYKNRPLYLDTKESEEGKKEGNPKAIFWTQTDDVPAEARLWASIFAIEDRLEINTSNSNRNAWLRQSDLPQYIYQATKAGI